MAFVFTSGQYLHFSGTGYTTQIKLNLHYQKPYFIITCLSASNRTNMKINTLNDSSDEPP